MQPRKPNHELDERVATSIRTLSSPRSTPASRAGAAAQLRACASAPVLSRVREACDAARLSPRSDDFFEELFAVRDYLLVAVAEAQEAALQERQAREREAAARFEAMLGVLLSRGSADAELLRAAEALEELPRPPDDPELARRVISALDGDWRSIATPAELRVRRLLGRWAKELAVLLGWRVDAYLPDVDVRVVAAVEGGKPGRLRPSYGLGLYDLHQEWPIDGFGVRKDRILVIEEGGRRPILEWLPEQKTRVLCPRCGGFLDRRVEQGCPSRRLRPER